MNRNTILYIVRRVAATFGIKDPAELADIAHEAAPYAADYATLVDMVKDICAGRQ